MFTSLYNILKIQTFILISMHNDFNLKIFIYNEWFFTIARYHTAIIDMYIDSEPLKVNTEKIHIMNTQLK